MVSRGENTEEKYLSSRKYNGKDVHGKDNTDLREKITEN
jgi:hypothetical protein